jgi:acyl-CoA synthetase (AMP-forming)/AMP-acid ligase II
MTAPCGGLRLSDATERHPDRPAVVAHREGDSTTFGELEDRSSRLAGAFVNLGLEAGDHIALLMTNTPGFFTVAWAAQRSGLYYTPVNTHLGAEEAGYILRDCGARALVVSPSLAALGAEAARLTPGVTHRLIVGGEHEGFSPCDPDLLGHPRLAVTREQEGAEMLYSSGTTGRPKGVKVPLADADAVVTGMTALLQRLWGFGPDSVLLSPAPLFHSAPLRTSMSAQRLGATVVLVPHFDPEETLAVIEARRVTHGQFVPTMFVRLLRLPPATRRRYDLSSLRVAIHAGAPCPIPVKAAMIDWWGPVLCEIYGGTEAVGMCHITAQEWLARPGSVGRPLGGAVHIVAEDGREFEAGEEGLIYFETGRRFEYHGDPVKTRRAYNERGWATLGDIGHLDTDGYLYLTDRRDHMIISGGVNVYPQEAENLLTMHPAVLDAAVFGVPNEEWGEEVKAVVQAVPGTVTGPALERDLIAFCRSQLAAYKCPRSVDFTEAMPRHDNGKLLKRLLRDHYRRPGK